MTHDISCKKAQLRKQILAERAQIPADKRMEKSLEIQNAIHELREAWVLEHNSDDNQDEYVLPVVALYQAMGSEVSLHELALSLSHHCYYICFPCMEQHDHTLSTNTSSESPKSTMVFREIAPHSYYEDMTRAPFLTEPFRTFSATDPALLPYPVVEPRDIDIVVVPLVAFDAHNRRLGYGGGNYDRFLGELRSDALVIGVAFEEQRVEAVPTEAHDLPLPHIVSR